MPVLEDFYNNIDLLYDYIFKYNIESTPLLQSSEDESSDDWLEAVILSACLQG